MRAFCELAADGRRIEVHFRYSAEAVEAIKEVPGARFVPSGKFWTVPLDLVSAQRLRDAFGEGLELGAAVKVWGQAEAKRHAEIAAVKVADDADLENVDPASQAWLRPYQRADVRMMALTSVLNANQPGVGKTVETIYAVQEAQLPGPFIVVAPLTLHKDPWVEELAAHAPGARVFWGESPAERRDAASGALRAIADGDTNVWLIVNPEMIRLRRAEPDDADANVLSRDHKGRAYATKPDNDDLFRQAWSVVVADEFHKFGLGADRNTLFARGLDALGKRATRRFALSGTPMGGKPLRLWGVLRWIEPELYSSKWRWAEQWLEIDDNGFGKTIGGMQPGREDAFYAAHARHMVRRRRKDALPGLPDKVTLTVDCPMTPKQRRAYDSFSEMAEVALDGGNLSAAGALAEFSRLKQLANALCEIDASGQVQPTTDSGKLPLLVDRLDTYGIRPAEDNPEPGARAIVASESARFIRLVYDYLASNVGLNADLLDGSVTGAARNDVIDWYKSDNPEARVLCMTTQTGGVGLNLGMTGSIHILDETWNPDDQEQLEDRGMRNRDTPLMVLYYRTEDSIQEYIAATAAGKRVTNANIIDLAKRMRTHA